jgi:hypothetical protein
LDGTYLYSGKYDQWLDEWQRTANLNNDRPFLAAVNAATEELRRSGSTAALRQMAKIQEEQSRTMYIDPATIAEYYGVIGDRDKAFAWLEKAASERSAFFLYIPSVPTRASPPSLSGWASRSKSLANGHRSSHRSRLVDRINRSASTVLAGLIGHRRLSTVLKAGEE